MKKFFKAVGILCFSVILSSLLYANETEVIDLAGRKVTIPKESKKVLALTGPSFEKILMLGETEKIVGVAPSAVNNWSKIVSPNIKNIPIIKNPKTPNVEELMSLGAEYAFYWNLPESIDKLKQVGIEAIVTQFPSNDNPKTIEEFIKFQKDEVRVTAQALGGEALEKEKLWNEYFDSKVDMILSRTKNLKPEEIPNVYYARSDEGLVCFSKNSYPQFLVEIAGGNYLAKDTLKEMNDTVTIEKIISWNPDVIFTGRLKSTKIITDNPSWSGLKAVQNNRVYLCPTGIKDWDYSSENILLLQYIAKMLHPELFKDIDMKKEIKYYYNTFYGYDISDENIENILNHKDPSGK
ncbi:ABC transporter substrate-binding protein [uncultured Fusobacterium sp.]|uniref:ABC transporter substrate-binding protein n=1 Tax=uncultured Fusobacterium sp. TaxID=159267 RepID=UPI0025E95E09|nr:ABC transporter substrate-binding protein [uncultured Fusobacterium sp.]